MQHQKNISGHTAFPVRIGLFCFKELEIEILQPKCLYEIKQKKKLAAVYAKIDSIPEKYDWLEGLAHKLYLRSSVAVVVHHEHLHRFNAEWNPTENRHERAEHECDFIAAMENVAS